jgi:signal transduction histidine kinase
VIVLPFLSYAAEAPALHVVLETAASLVAMLVAFLVYGRYRRNGRLQELLLVCSLAVAAVASVMLTALPTALAGAGGPAVSRWAPLVVRFVATLLLVLAALTPAHVRLKDRRAGPLLVSLALSVTGLAVLALLLGDTLPPPVDPTQVPVDSARATVTGHPVALGAQVVGAMLYGVAAVAFTRQASRASDELLRWVGAACVLAAFARVNYLLFPSLYGDFVYVGDVLRFGYYLLLLVGAAREISGYWANQAKAAVREDRRRLARDLHDGLTQELNYICAQARALVRTHGDLPGVAQINSAAVRALDEARGAIGALTRTSAAGFYDVLLATTDGLASRYEAQVVLDVDDAVPLAPAEGDAVLRIVAEAFRNAVLHGGATCVVVSMSGRPLRLQVRDDGAGFDLATSGRREGYGLTSMRERAEGLGAEFAVGSTLGRGTCVTVTWP